jgi:outer membrane immunogenic protein
MKKYLVAAALVGTGFSAQAADLAVKAPYVKAPFVAPVYNWTGFYFGINGGIGNSRDYTQLSHTAAGLPGDPVSFVGGFGGVGGAQIGYNWQYGDLIGLGNLVLGLEADIQGAGLQDKSTCAFFCQPGSGFLINQKLDWFGTARGRAGIATGPVLSYITAGYAYGGVSTTITDTSIPQAATFSGTRGGWTWGTGVEASLGGAWTGKLEWLTIDLGTQTGVNLVSAYNFRSEIRENIFRAGLNYRLGGVDVPVPVRDWTGFYLGGNATLASALNRSTLTSVAPAIVNESFNLSPNGFIAGGQLGYNWQSSNWVFGLEGDFQGSSQRDSNVCQLGCSLVGPLAVFNQKQDWLATGRGRLGYSVGSSLFYATGGVAYGDIKTAITGTAGGAPINVAFAHTKTGYAVGGGIETPLSLFGWFGRNWTTKTEYLYVDLGRTSDVIPGLNATFTTHAQEQLIRTGLNYNFNTPVIAKY